MELKRILKSVSEVMNIPESDIKGKVKTKEIVLARQLYCYTSLKKTHKSLMEIGELVNRNHATVIHSQKKISYEIEFYPEILHFIKTINLNLKNVDKKWLNYHTIYNNINISHTL